MPGLPGGYCASPCGPTCARSHGACVAARDAEVCMKACSDLRDCRGDAGYVCDSTLHACVVPNFAAPAIAQCTAQSSGRDPAFGDSERTDVDASSRSGAAAIVADDGSVIVRGDARLARRGSTIYTATRADGQITLATSSDRGATWSAAAVQDANDCSETGCDHANVVAGTDRIYVLYGAAAGGLRVRRSRDGATFATGALALIGSYGNAVVTSDGKLHVVALAGSVLGAYGSAEQHIDYAVSADGGESFTRPSAASGELDMLPYFAANPALAIDERRRLVYVAYVRGGRYDAWEIMLAVSKDRGATWKRTRLPTASCATHLLPNLAIDPATGTLHVAYYDSETATGRFVHASCAPGATKCKVAGAINSTPFAGLSLSRGSPNWLGDYASLVIDGKRRVLHATWTQPVVEGDAAVTRIFHASAKLKK